MTDREKDKRPYFVLINENPRHRKSRHQFDKAFRVHLARLGLCNENTNDGIISKQELNMLGPGAHTHVVVGVQAAA